MINIDPETRFLQGLIELQYGENVQEKLKRLSMKIPWAKNWPENNKSFWNAEAFMWSFKIDKIVREVISKELSSLQGKNLDLGCGAYSYLPSIGFDFSEKMLKFNTNCIKKIVGSLEEKLPFRESSFDSITAIFVLNYIKNYSLLLSEIFRVLKDDGNFIAVLYSKNINPWQRQKEANSFVREDWGRLMGNHNFTVDCYQKDNLCFFRCKKKKN